MRKKESLYQTTAVIDNKCFNNVEDNAVIAFLVLIDLLSQQNELTILSIFENLCD